MSVLYLLYCEQAFFSGGVGGGGGGGGGGVGEIVGCVGRQYSP